MNQKYEKLYQTLANAIGEAAARELRLLVAAITGQTYAQVFTCLPPLVDDTFMQLEACVQRRVQGEPLSRIIGRREFYGREFHINAHVLDPRPDSETLIDVILTHCHTPAPQILELGVGSGCLLLTLLCELPKAQGLGVDISEEALTVAKHNSHALGVEARATWQHSNWFENVSGSFDVIVSNPPYIAPHEPLEDAVYNYDPHLALFGGQSGLEAYKAILGAIRSFMKPKGQAFLEIGYTQAAAVCAMVQAHEGLQLKGVYKDLAGHDRVVHFGLKE